MSQSTPEPEPAGLQRGPANALDATESARYFELERLEERRKRLASCALLSGLLSVLLLLVPNPVPWLFGPLALLLGSWALLRSVLQPQRCAGRLRATIGLVLGAVSTLIALRLWERGA